MEHNCKTCDFFQLLDADEISGFCENDIVDGYVFQKDHIDCPYWKNSIRIRHKKISFVNCPFRVNDELYESIPYCSLNHEYCDVCRFNNLSKQCPLFEEVN